MRHAMTLVVGLAVLMLASGARADWDKDDPYKMHWPQWPDAGLGMNVDASTELYFGGQHVLADDFLCTETGPITDIHIWGSWLEDRYPVGGRFPGPGDVGFDLGIYSDIPAEQSPTDYSMPGRLLWTERVNGSKFQLHAMRDEDFFAPGRNEIIGTDTRMYQYNFIDFDEPFVQEKDTIYWLSVTAFPANEPGAPQPNTAYFGWKTSDRPWNDDAVFWVEYADGTSTTPQELRDPRFDPPPSLDLAFVITPEPASLALLGLGAVGLAARRRRRQA